MLGGLPSPAEMCANIYLVGLVDCSRRKDGQDYLHTVSDDVVASG